MTKLLKNLSLGELKTLYDENKDFSHVVWETTYENNMFWQQEQSEELLGKDNRGYSYHDNYSSFYFRLTDCEHFLNDLPESCRDYLPECYVELYDKAKRLLDKWENMTYDEQDEDEGTYNDLEKTAEELLKAIEETLHEFEVITDDQTDDTLQAIIDDCLSMSDWELLDDGKTIAQHTTTLYK